MMPATSEDWEELRPPPPGRRREREVTAGMFQYGRALPRLHLTFDEATVRKLGDPDRDRFIAQLGRSAEQRPYLRVAKAGPDAGPRNSLRITRFHAGRNGPSKVFRLLLPKHKRMPLCEIKAVDVDYRIERGVLVVTLPSWAWDKDAKERAETARQRALTGGRT